MLISHGYYLELAIAEMELELPLNACYQNLKQILKELDPDSKKDKSYGLILMNF